MNFPNNQALSVAFSGIGQTVLESTMTTVFKNGIPISLDGAIMNESNIMKPGVIAHFCGVGIRRFIRKELSYEAIKQDAPDLSDERIWYSIEATKAQGNYFTIEGKDYRNIWDMVNISTEEVLRASRVTNAGEVIPIFE